MLNGEIVKRDQPPLPFAKNLVYGSEKMSSPFWVWVFAIVFDFGKIFAIVNLQIFILYKGFFCKIVFKQIFTVNSPIQLSEQNYTYLMRIFTKLQQLM